MRIGELEKVLREAVRVHPGQSPVALLAGGGSLAGAIPAEFVPSIRSLSNRTDDGARSLFDKDLAIHWI